MGGVWYKCLVRYMSCFFGCVEGVGAWRCGEKLGGYLCHSNVFVVVFNLLAVEWWLCGLLFSIGFWRW